MRVSKLKEKFVVVFSNLEDSVGMVHYDTSAIVILISSFRLSRAYSEHRSHIHLSLEEVHEGSGIRLHLSKHNSLGESTKVEISEGQRNLSSTDVRVVSIKLSVSLLDHANPDFISIRSSFRVQRCIVVRDRQVVVNNDLFNVSILSELQQECSRSFPVVTVEGFNSAFFFLLRFEESSNLNIFRLISHDRDSGEKVTVTDLSLTNVSARSASYE